MNKTANKNNDNKKTTATYKIIDTDLGEEETLEVTFTCKLHLQNRSKGGDLKSIAEDIGDEIASILEDIEFSNVTADNLRMTNASCTVKK